MPRLIPLAVLFNLIAVSSGLAFDLIASGKPAAVWVDPASPKGVQTVAGWFADDLQRVSGARPEVVATRPESAAAVLVGVVGAGGQIDRLAREGLIDVSRIKGQREASVTVEVAGDSPLLVVAGSDKRGAIYGLLDLSREMGVSPWYWWADAPVQKKSDYSVASAASVRPASKVRYRGIFINDEAPALTGMVNEKFGAFNSEFYAHVYELILRLRGNFLWPAMWKPRSLFEDDPRSQALADELGVVIGTTHHEPMHRAHIEWEKVDKGPWDYSRNAENLQEFWRAGIRRMGDAESVVTLGMRGDGDAPMSREANISLLERIVKDQRQILAEELGRDVTTQPQVWALYKEVQEYYDRGMTVPDDVILLLCDDNWGNVRRLPSPGGRRQPGGYGMYYHFDYVGGPRNYKWINTNALPRIWEQMHLTWKHGVDQVWVVNVGDIKPMEEPIDFFLTLAYDPDAFPADRASEAIDAWRVEFAQENLGAAHAEVAADLLKRYAMLAARRKPEQLDASTYHVTNYNEWDRVLGEWRSLMNDAESLERQLPDRAQSTYYQLVLHPVLALGNLHEMYYAHAKNQLLARADDPEANYWADEVERAYNRDSELTERYHSIEGGKWNHMMDQNHIGYRSWQEPARQTMPQVRRVEGAATAPAAAEVAAAGDQPPSAQTGPFLERDNYVSIEAEHYSNSIPAKGVEWRVVKGLGRTGSSMITTPVNAPSTPLPDAPRLEYPIKLTTDGDINVIACFAPNQDVYGEDDHGIRFAASLDDGAPVVIDLHAELSTMEVNSGAWNRRVSDAAHVVTTPSIKAGAGEHTLKIWRIDPGLVLQKIVVTTGRIEDSYLGPPESPRDGSPSER